MPSFTGFPVAALDFYDDLEVDNSKSFWEANKTVYADQVRAPMVALVEELAGEFGRAKVFRPYRDVRFAKDKTPFKTHQGAFVAAGPATGWYVEVSAAGVQVGVGFYQADRASLAAIRAAIADDVRGRQLASIVTQLQAEEWAVGGDTLKTAPRGYEVAHPRIDLLRHRSLALRKHYGFPEAIHTSALLDWVRRDWRAGRPLIEWVQDCGT